MLDILKREQRSLGPGVIGPGPWGSWPGDTVTKAAVTVTESSALQLLAVSGCVTLIADSIATLPVDTFYRGKNGVARETVPPRWLKQPTVDLDFVDWATQVLSSSLLNGNSYIAVTRDAMGEIVELVPIDPSIVSVGRVDGRKVFFVGGNRYFGELRHMKGIMLAGQDVGVSPLEWARLSIGLGLAAVEYGGDSLSNGNNMPGVIENTGFLSPEQQMDQARAWKRLRTRKDRGLPGLLINGSTWKPTGVTNEQAQFLQLRQWTAAEIAGQVFFVDPRELGIPITGSTLDYTNAESRSAALLKKAMLKWIIRLEHLVTGLLPFREYMKLNVDGFLRGSATERWDVYQKASLINTQAAGIGQPPVLDTAEMREFEDLGPYTRPSPEVKAGTND